MNSDLMPSPESSNFQPQTRPITEIESAANVHTVAAQAPKAGKFVC